VDILRRLMAEDLSELHLADLHARAAELGVPRFRLLRRSELVSEIEARGGGKGSGGGETGTPRREPPRRRDDRGEDDDGRERERLEPDETEDVTGLLEIMPQRFGFLRLQGLDEKPDDVYISAAQVRRCELRTGDQVAGPARSPKRGERHRALVHVDRVNGVEPQSERPRFDDLTPVPPQRRVPLDHDPADVLTRAVDLLAPVALGQRVLIRAAPRSGRTTLLRGLARAIDAAEEIEVVVLLVDERPEEATAWREALPGAEIATATADLAPADQVRVARFALERARRRVEAGADVVLLVDSLSRLAVAAGDVAEVRRLFGSGRETAEEGAGSLTVIATVLDGADDDGAGERAVITTESSLIRLDPTLAAAGIVPALQPSECVLSNEEALRPAKELASARGLRWLLADLDPVEAASQLRDRIEGSSSNGELLGSLG
jgi:transcription termination factor Rho